MSEISLRIPARESTVYDSFLFSYQGCEYHGYCGDITRTWPVNGKFSKYQRILYEIVLEVQLKLISLCQERRSLDDLHKHMTNLLGSYLTEEKIIAENVTNSQERIMVSGRILSRQQKN